MLVPILSQTLIFYHSPQAACKRKNENIQHGQTKIKSQKNAFNKCPNPCFSSAIYIAGFKATFRFVPMQITLYWVHQGNMLHRIILRKIHRKDMWISGGYVFTKCVQLLDTLYSNLIITLPWKTGVRTLLWKRIDDASPGINLENRIE